MPSANPLLLVAKRVPWARAWLVGQWLYRHGNERLQKNLTTKERSELWELTRKSKGLHSNLSPKQQQRFIALVRQGMRGRGS